MPSGTTCTKFQVFKSQIDKMKCVQLQQSSKMHSSHGLICRFMLPIDNFPSIVQVVAGRNDQLAGVQDRVAGGWPEAVAVGVDSR